MVKYNKYFGIMSESEAREKLAHTSKTFVSMIIRLCDLKQLSRVRMLGIGNSIMAGWTATDNNVNPLLNKLDEFLLPLAESTQLDLDISSYSLAGRNSNDKVLELIKANPSLNVIRELFEENFDDWKIKFRHTAFQNYVDKEKAMAFYPNSDKRFNENFGEDTLTLTIFSGNTGAFMETAYENGLKLLIPLFRKTILEDELCSLKFIIRYITELTENSFITTTNFPYISTIIGDTVNRFICNFNKDIEAISQEPRSLYFDRITLSLIQKYRGHFKIDNHPTLDEQYTSLYKLLQFLIETLPVMCLLDEFNNNPEKKTDSLFDSYVQKYKEFHISEPKLLQLKRQNYGYH